VSRIVCFFIIKYFILFTEQIYNINRHISKKFAKKNQIIYNSRIFVENMVKKGIIYIVTILFATYFLMAGTGFNVVKYCCNSCADAGIVALANGSCEDVHHHSPTLKNHHPSNDIACSNIEHQPNGCHLLRLFIDTPSVVVKPLAVDNTINSIDLFYAFQNILVQRSLIPTLSVSPPPDYCFFSSGREIITLHAVLLI
jgi:hypothetical protein